MESSEWPLWLKFAWSLVQTTSTNVVQNDVVGTIDALEDVYESAYAAYHEADNTK